MCFVNCSVTSLVLLNPNAHIHWSHFRDTAGSLLSLTHLTIGVYFVLTLLPDGFESTINFPVLHSLRIHVRGHTPYPDQFLLGISAPSLKLLALKGMPSEDPNDFCVDGAKLQELDKFPCLLSLTLLDSNMYYGVSQETWTSFYNMFPHITHLAFDHVQIQETSLDPCVAAMVSNSTNSDTTKPLILPELHTLLFGKMHLFSINFLSNLVST